MDVDPETFKFTEFPYVAFLERLDVRRLESEMLAEASKIDFGGSFPRIKQTHMSSLV